MGHCLLLHLVFSSQFKSQYEKDVNPLQIEESSTFKSSPAAQVSSLHRSPEKRDWLISIARPSMTCGFGGEQSTGSLFTN
jgi:hypothetical protein